MITPTSRLSYRYLLHVLWPVAAYFKGQRQTRSAARCVASIRVHPHLLTCQIQQPARQVWGTVPFAPDQQGQALVQVAERTVDGRQPTRSPARRQQ